MMKPAANHSHENQSKSRRLANLLPGIRSRRQHAVPAGYQDAIELPHEQAFELYHNPMSLCSMKVRLCLSELGIAYRSHVIDLIETGAYENIRPHFLKVNPAGTVPVLLHRGHPVYESHKQIRYAAANAPGGARPLIPADPELRQSMEFWIDRTSLLGNPVDELSRSAGNCAAGLTFPLFCAMIREIPVWRIGEGLIFHAEKKKPLFFLALKLLGLSRLHWIRLAWRIYQQSQAQMAIFIEALENQLQTSGGPWLLGREFTLADIGWLAILERFRQVDCLDMFINDRTPACRDYWQALNRRDAYAEAVLSQEHPVLVRGTRYIRECKSRDKKLRARLEGPLRTT